ncbi:hypothetical protein CERZMDRAFT_88607 [Cercospora zeae-maydis SCOH1-5]|uniref:Uncharacterized protein n=1 Tax=Cercospora zeae-maydis SCOH1-5 TaxID=717836 RepID=A0A6A6EYU1_9PEZI|nr:hypothetical protein CERZMDRAFT_88607 [Cercospora zeae-maydis SCOH1-5]
MPTPHSLLTPFEQQVFDLLARDNPPHPVILSQLIASMNLRHITEEARTAILSRGDIDLLLRTAATMHGTAGDTLAALSRRADEGEVDDGQVLGSKSASSVESEGPVKSAVPSKSEPTVEIVPRILITKANDLASSSRISFASDLEEEDELFESARSVSPEDDKSLSIINEALSIPNSASNPPYVPRGSSDQAGNVSREIDEEEVIKTEPGKNDIGKKEKEEIRKSTSGKKVTFEDIDETDYSFERNFGKYGSVDDDETTSGMRSTITTTTTTTTTTNNNKNENKNKKSRKQVHDDVPHLERTLEEVDAELEMMRLEEAKARMKQ